MLFFKALVIRNIVKNSRKVDNNRITFKFDSQILFCITKQKIKVFYG